jgi:hypothetical protein
MKKLFIALFALAGIMTAHATEANDTTMTTLSDIIAMESQSKMNNDNTQRLRNIWSKNTFFNISYNTTKFSSEEFPSIAGATSIEYKNKLGVGIQWGQTFNFHKKPLGGIVFIGLDYTWMDLNFNQYKKQNTPAGFADQGEGGIRNMPWHNEKMTLDYGMSIGPSLTLYPFAPLHHDGADKVRLQGYFHVGYSAHGAMIKDVPDRGMDVKNRFAWGHGLFTGIGANLTWNAIGIGYECRTDNKITYKHIDGEFDNGKMKCKQKTNRVYLQFRF